MSEADVRASFREQARICAGLGSPFTAKVCELAADRLAPSTPVGRRVLDWRGDPRPHADALPLRFAGALHACARRGEPAGVARAWPPNAISDDDTLWAAIETACGTAGAFILAWLDSPPQTNEVGRSGPLAAGLLVLADRFGLPFDLYELGCSAGLNLNLDRYAFDLGGVATGDRGSAVRLAPDWDGPPPPDAKIVVATRQGVDLSPLDVSRPEAAERLLAYVWADQRERLTRLDAALEIARAYPPPVTGADGADWWERQLSVEPTPGLCRVVMHTIALQYFTPEGRGRVVAHLDREGAAATAEAPLAWLSYEAAEAPDADGRRWAELSLTVWPGGQRRVLARGHPHGFAIQWRA